MATRAQEIQRRIDRLEKIVRRIQGELYQDVMDYVLAHLIYEKGSLVNTERQYTKNLAEIARITSVFEAFARNQLRDVAFDIVKDFDFIVNLNELYFDDPEFAIKKKDYNRIQNNIRSQSDEYLGIKREGKRITLKSGGFINDFVNDNTIAAKIKGDIATSVSTGASQSDLRERITKTIKGVEERGALQKRFDQFVYDQYARHDRIVSYQWAVELGLEAFQYDGGIIGTSRNFCRAKSGKPYKIKSGQRKVKGRKRNVYKTISATNKSAVWHVKETDTWEAELKRLDKIVITGYNPFIHAGVYNCRHILNWITMDRAIKLRPSIKKYFKLNQAA